MTSRSLLRTSRGLMRDILGITASEEPCDVNIDLCGLQERDVERVVGALLSVAAPSENTGQEAKTDGVDAAVAIAIADTDTKQWIVLTCRENCNADMIRAAGDVACEACGLSYRKHPRCRGHYDRSGEYYWLHVLCDGLHVKL
jgi:hypothetical protein